MKKTLFFICSFLFLGTFTSNAQLWKKLKQKAQEKIQKAENKIVDEIDKTVSGKGSKKEKSQKTDFPKNDNQRIGNSHRDEDFGDAKFTYSHTYQVTNIATLGSTSINKTGNKFRISGNWWSHSVDVYDGYSVEIKNTNLEELALGKTYRIPSEATLYIGYDPISGVKRDERAKLFKGHIENEIESGTITIKYIKDKKIDISFKANGIISNDNNEKPIVINGSIVTKKPEFSRTKEVKQNSNNNNNSSNDVSDEDLEKLYESVSPTVNIPDSYSFNKTVSIEITDNRGEKMPITYLLGDYPDIYGISINPEEMGGQGNVYVVTTPKSTTMFMDMGMMKIRRSTSLEQVGGTNNFSDKLPEDGDFEYKKTGRTKSILGYDCEEYKVDYEYTNEKGSVSFWVSKDFPIQNKELPMLGMKMNNPYFTGFVLEMNSTNNGDNWTMKIVDVEDKNITINKNDYRKM
jgi:hypothetical protein